MIVFLNDDYHMAITAVIHLSAGQRLSEGAQRPAAGGFHVQRIEKTRLRGRFQMAIAVH